MIVKSTVKIGGKVFTFAADEKNEMEALHKAIILGNPRRKCGICGNDNPKKFQFTSNKDKKGHIYVNVKCYGKVGEDKFCEARSKLGQYLVGGYFWHEFEKYIPKASREEPPVPEEESRGA